MAEEKRREPCCEELRTAGVLNRERLGGDATGDLQDGNTDPAAGVQMLDTLHQSVEYRKRNSFLKGKVVNLGYIGST